jgi:tetratricopeptide (TPR) repeat protein
MRRVILLLWLVLGLPSALSCQARGAASELSELTSFAELRSVKGALTVTAPGQSPRAPYPRERLVEGEQLELPASGLAWLRRDGGATWLVSGPASLTLHADRVELTRGRVFVDSEQADPARVDTPRGTLELGDARASVEIGDDGAVSAYVLRGSARSGESLGAGAGERLTLLGDGKTELGDVVSWQDWTGGLGTADPAAAPAPFGIGTVGARKPGEQGRARFSLVITRLDVRVSIDHDFAVTEVDQTFVNPSSDAVEGLFRFRTPARAVLQRFGVDRSGELVWGRILESAEAERQYESNVYQGSLEDPALLSWQGAGVYQARLYPIPAGAERRVVTRYAEWLPRHGVHGERRLYVYPMAAEGAKGSLPRIEELTVTFDLRQAAAKSMRVGMNGTRTAQGIVVKAFDFVPRADLALELYDEGRSDAVAYRAPHALPAEEAPENAGRQFAADVSREEADYIAIPLRAPRAAADAAMGLDLALVIDTSAATEPSALAIARSIAASLLSHLGPEDRAALWVGDATLRPVAPGAGALGVVDAATRKLWLTGLAAAERGGATDLGALLTEAASQLDPNRRGAVVYIGDGAPSVGELIPAALSERMRRLPPTARVLAAAVGSQPNLAVLESIARGAPVEQVSDAYGAARSALRLLEAAGRSLWLEGKLDLGPNVDRILPRTLPPIAADETLMVVGRVTGPLPARLRLSGSGGSIERRLSARRFNDSGDLRRRWGEERLRELLASGAGRASLVELGRRFGVVSPVTSLYVPTRREAERAEASTERPEEELVVGALARRRQISRWKPWASSELSDLELPSVESRLSAAMVTEEGRRSAGAQPKDQALTSSTPGSAPPELHAMAPASPSQRGEQSAQAFGSITAPDTVRRGPADTSADTYLEDRSVAFDGAGNAWGPGIGTGQGFGAGRGRTGAQAHARSGGSHAALAPQIRAPEGGFRVTEGGLAIDRVRRIVRQSFGRFRLCYEQGLSRRPDLAGRLTVGVSLSRDGLPDRVHIIDSTVSDADMVDCIQHSFQGLSFDKPDNGRGAFEYTVVFATDTSSLASAEALGVSVAPPSPAGVLGGVLHVRSPCGPAADLPLSERSLLWRERLALDPSVQAVLRVYTRALSDCEASEWRERTALLLHMVDSLSATRDRVALWQSLLLTSPMAADAVYRALLARVQTSQDLKELHEALGLVRIDPELLDALLKRARSTAERLALLRGASEKFGDDTELALLVLDAYEDAADDAGGRAWARKLRRRSDATAHVRTHVGEYYLRRSAKGAGPLSARDADEARRTFGELVEFAPEDPLSRRRLGDLLAAHGWHEQALRQYETLAALTPDDPSVPLLLATAAQGTGKVEEAVRWLEKAGASASPDGGGEVPLAARALASAFLAWAREDSARAGATEEVERLRLRAARLLTSEPAASVRVVLSWSHPELRPALWTDALGSMMPARDNLPLLGVAQAFVAATPAPRLELRLDPEDAARAARLEAQARLTVLIGEGTDVERIARADVSFRGKDGSSRSTLAFRLVNGALVEEAP